MSAKEELRRITEDISEQEANHLLRAVRAVHGGDRFWEDDMGVVYNEYVKARYRDAQHDMSTVVGGPDPSGDLFVPVPITKAYPGADVHVLPPLEPIDAPMGRTMLARRSRRDYSDEAISLSRISTLLHHACGTTGWASGYGYTRLPLRAFPSSGGLQAPEVYVCSLAVQGLAPGLYHYRPIDHCLQTLKPGSHGALLAGIAFGQGFVMHAAAVLVLTGVYERLRWKYGDRAYRYMCMDCGIVAGNLHLAAEALGLGSCAIAGFLDDALEAFLGIDGRDEMLMLMMALGNVSGRRTLRQLGSAEPATTPEPP